MTDKVIKKLELTLERLKDIDDKENSNKIEILLKELKELKNSKKSKSKKGKSKKSKSKGKSKSKSKGKSKSKSKGKSKGKSKKSKSKSKSKGESKGCSEKDKKIDITFNTDQINNKGGKKNIVTMYNGGYYYYVDISNKSINVYAKTGESNETKKNYDLHFNKHVLCTDYKDVFIGDDKKDKNGYGNSILINTKDNEYIYICDIIIKFTTKNKITKYYSPIGNSAVPYPYALDKKGQTYLIYDEEKKEIFIPVLEGKYKDAWGDYYGNTGNDVNIVDTIKVNIVNKID